MAQFKHPTSGHVQTSKNDAVAAFLTSRGYEAQDAPNSPSADDAEETSSRGRATRKRDTATPEDPSQDQPDQSPQGVN